MAETEVKSINGRAIADTTAREAIKALEGSISGKPVVFYCLGRTDPLHPFGNMDVVASAEELVAAYFAGTAYIKEGVEPPSRIIAFYISNSDVPARAYAVSSSIGTVESYVTGVTSSDCQAEINKYLPGEG